jgi:lipopolysaccharide/colanic/teichoic acid biosynthesis glycosyltransferase
MNPTLYSRHAKRLFDATVSAFGLVLLSPLLLLVAIAVRLTSPGPALFSQTRTGFHEKPFPILKFRSMKAAPANAAAPLLTAQGDSRITPLGRWLRKTKIDELPQLLNVLAGHMSLVGPRPEVPRYTSRYTPAQRKVFAARPGITGPSIILNEEELMATHPDTEAFYLSTILPAKLAVDLSYCERIRFRKDLRILFVTLSRLFYRPALPPSQKDVIVHLAAGTSQISSSR